MSKTTSNTLAAVVAQPQLDKKAVAAFLKANPALNLQKFNFLNPAAVAALQWEEGNEAILLPQLKALQRLVRLTGNVDSAEALYNQGLHSALQIASMPAHKFVDQYKTAFVSNGLSAEAQAQQAHQKALARKSQAVLSYTAIKQQTAPYYRASRFDNLSAATDKNFDHLPSYQDLFGSLDFCTCEECRSIFSPAAYFVDIMRLQDNYITGTTYSLKSRRPDLWERVLSCENTNTLVSKLKIVDEVLGAKAYENITPLPSNAPLLFLPFHNSIEDASGNEEQITPTPATGAVNFVPGRLGSNTAVTFNKNAYLTTAKLSLANTYTLTAWVKLQAQGAGNLIQTDDGGITFSINTDGTIQFATKTKKVTSGSQHLTRSQWQHIAVTVEGNNITLYLSGQQVGTDATTNDATLKAGLKIGSGFTGALGQLAVYNTVLSPQQLNNLAQTSPYEELYAALETINYPFNLPFNLPITQINQYLSANKTSLAAIWEHLSEETPRLNTAVALEMLPISPQQWEVCKDAKTKDADIAPCYGVSIPQGKTLAEVLAPIDPPDNDPSRVSFLGQTGLTLDQLKELLFEDLGDEEITDKKNTSFFINAGTDAPIGISTDGKSLTNLNTERLDHINRFIRLAQALGWSFTDLDWALQTIGHIVNKGTPVINDAVLPYLAWMQQLDQKQSFAINQSCAAIGTVKDFGQGPGPDFFEQVFSNANIPNPPMWQDVKGNYSLIWNVPQPDDISTPSDADLQIQNALLAALKVSQNELLTIANQVSHAPTIAVVGGASQVAVYALGPDNQWSASTTLDPIQKETSSLALEGQWIMVGDSKNKKVYVYKLDENGQWPTAPTQELAIDGAQLGASVALSGSWAMMGDGTSNKVYVYKLGEDGKWQKQDQALAI